MPIKKKKRKPRSASKLRLFDQVVQLTGIPTQSIRRELLALMKKKNINPDDLSLEQLRSVAASYLREIMGGLLENSPIRRQDRVH